MLLDFILDNQGKEKVNKTFSGYNNYTGQIVFDYSSEKSEKKDGNNDKEEQNKYLKSEEIFLPI